MAIPSAEKRNPDSRQDRSHAGPEDPPASIDTELIDRLSALLPGGGRVLEAGCGDGWHSQALARTGRFRTALLDPSRDALSAAARTFESESLAAELIEADLTATGTPDFDLVFNVGVLDRHERGDRIAILRAMASRSRRFVLVVTPDSRGLWYWLHRLRAGNEGSRLRKELAVENPADIFQAAGLHFLGQAYLGQSGVGSLIAGLGLGRELTDRILDLHRSGAIPPEYSASFVGVLAGVNPSDRVPEGWSAPGRGEEWSPVLAAVLVDALAHRNGLERGIEPNAWIGVVDRLSAQVAELRTECHTGLVERAGLAASLRESEYRRTGLETELTAARERVENLSGERDHLSRTLDAAIERAIVAEQKSSGARARHEILAAEKDRLGGELQSALNRAALAGQEARSARAVFERETEVVRAQCRDLRAHAEKTEEELIRRIHAYDAERAGNERLSAELAGAQNEHNRLSAELTEARNERDRLSRENVALTLELGQRAEDLAALESASAGRSRELETETAAHINRLQIGIAGERAHADKIKRELETLRSRLVTSAGSFASAFEERIEAFRAQRAWLVMLAIRKAYTLWMHGGWSGKLQCLRIPFQLLTHPRSAFADQELSFPDVWNYWPTVSGDSTNSLGIPAPAEDAAQSVPVYKFDVVILAVFDFEFRFQRPQQVAAQFARMGHRVFWVSPARRPRGDGREFETVQLRENMWEVRLPAAPFNLFQGALEPDRVLRSAYSFQEIFRDLGISESVTLVQFPYWRRIALDLRERFGAPVIYDCMDDWQNWTAEPRISAFSLAEESKLASECDVLVATSALLAKRLQTQSGRTALRVRNGADWDFFHSSEPNSLLAGLPHPIVGYYGAIADWVDVDLMTALTAARPQYSFVFIGEVHDRDVSRLQDLPNARLLGEKNYRLIPSYLRNFDVCLLPFVMSDLTRAVDPVKVYEYLSQGKPVIASPLPELQDHGDILYLATGVNEFAAQLDRALAEDSPSRQDARIAFAKINSWSARVDQIETSVTEAFPLVSILILSWNSCEYLKPCIDSILRNTSYPRYEVIVVDNGSTDGSRDFLSSCAPDDPRFRIILLDENLGFAGGNNVAARAARGDYLILLNADTIVTRGWIGRLMRPFRADSATGFTVPVTNFSGNETKVNVNYRNLERMEEFARDRALRCFGQTSEPGMAPLFCTMLPRRIWDEIGELDETFAVGMFEDDDFSLRARKAGYKIVTVEDCFIHHFGNGSFVKLPPGQALEIFKSNRARFEQKWNVEWKGHKTRPGVAPPSDADRIPLPEFLAGAPGSKSALRTLILKRLFPDRVERGRGANPQADGSSALVVECENEIPGTAIQFGETLLPTTPGRPGIMSATLPPGFSATPGKIPVSLVDDIGRSNFLNFVVED